MPQRVTTTGDPRTDEGAAIRSERADANSIKLIVSGRWKIGAPLPAADEALQQVESMTGLKCVRVDAAQVSTWDSTLLTLLLRIKAHCARKGLAFEPLELPSGVQRLLKLAATVPAREGARRSEEKERFLVRLGAAALGVREGSADVLAFIGEAFLALCRFFAGRAQFQRADLLGFIWTCGPQALPIVTLISLLVGLILAFVGAIQLLMFGAQIYVANLVAVAMVRVMGAVMAAVIMAGRTGAAFAAQLGTMQVNEEIDALKTLGISPMEFLVLPRMLALVVMMPLLCIYADIMGILGGLVVGVGMLNLGLIEYLNQTQASLSLTYFWIGLFYSAVFGVLIALSGCLRGLQCGRSASAVGEATTSAVVTSIVAIVVATAIITFAFNVIGI
jgi:phospholipid/cholesterol/gamma-HCH transport system permease protein